MSDGRLSLLPVLAWLDTWRYRLEIWHCALSGHDWPNWECDDCFDHYNVGMSCDHANLYRMCAGCGAFQAVREGLPWAT